MVELHVRIGLSGTVCWRSSSGTVEGGGVLRGET